MLIYSRLPKATHGRVISRFFCDWTLQFVEVSDSERLGRCAWNPRWRGRWRTFRWSSLAGFDQKWSELKENHIDIADVDRFSDFRIFGQLLGLRLWKKKLGARTPILQRRCLAAAGNPRWTCQLLGDRCCNRGVPVVLLVPGQYEEPKGMARRVTGKSVSEPCVRICGYNRTTFLFHFYSIC